MRETKLLRALAKAREVAEEVGAVDVAAVLAQLEADEIVRGKLDAIDEETNPDRTLRASFEDLVLGLGHWWSDQSDAAERKDKILLREVAEKCITEIVVRYPMTPGVMRYFTASRADKDRVVDEARRQLKRLTSIVRNSLGTDEQADDFGVRSARALLRIFEHPGASNVDSHRRKTHTFPPGEEISAQEVERRRENLELQLERETGRKRAPNPKRIARTRLREKRNK